MSTLLSPVHSVEQLMAAAIIKWCHQSHCATLNDACRALTKQSLPLTYMHASGNSDGSHTPVPWKPCRVEFGLVRYPPTLLLNSLPYRKRPLQYVAMATYQMRAKYAYLDITHHVTMATEPLVNLRQPHQTDDLGAMQVHSRIFSRGH